MLGQLCNAMNEGMHLNTNTEQITDMKSNLRMQYKGQMKKKIIIRVKCGYLLCLTIYVSLLPFVCQSKEDFSITCVSPVVLSDMKLFVNSVGLQQVSQLLSVQLHI